MRKTLGSREIYFWRIAGNKFLDYQAQYHAYVEAKLGDTEEANSLQVDTPALQIQTIFK